MGRFFLIGGIRQSLGIAFVWTLKGESDHQEQLTSKEHLLCTGAGLLTLQAGSHVVLALMDCSGGAAGCLFHE